jgi:formylglycine-generating enzyme required for sulfatase activity
MVRIPGSEFFMGVPEEENIPTQKGKLTRTPSFLIDRLEVSVDDYMKCRNAGECKEPLSDKDHCNATEQPPQRTHPMNCVSWKEAQTFCKWRGKRLPTSTEWELAARGTDKRPFPWGSAPPSKQLCWQGPNGKTKRTTCPVGSFPEGANPFGVLDMAGNVAEWTSTPNTSRGAQYTYYGIRGGSYALDRDAALAYESDHAWTNVRVDWDATSDPLSRMSTIGWRCAADAP